MKIGVILDEIDFGSFGQPEVVPRWHRGAVSG